MWTEELAWLQLRAEQDGLDAEERLRHFVVNLERSGIRPQQIARALSRVLLGFCAEHARKVENFGWILFLLGAVADLMHYQSKQSRSNWVERYMKQTRRLYNEARFMIQSETAPPLPPFALEASTPQGRA